METKELILETANNLLIERGFNAFSYKDISEEIAIKTSSIHYHFPTKSDLGIALVQKHHQAMQQTITKTSDRNALEKLNKLFYYYKKLVAEQKVCVIGALTSDINTLNENLRQELLLFGNSVINWAATILEEGQQQKVFQAFPNTKLKAKLIVAQLMAVAQIARIEKSSKSFDQMTQLILNELITQ